MGWYENATRWTEQHRFGVDATGAAALALFLVAASAAEGMSTHGGVWFALALCVALAWRRTRPAASVATVYALALVQLMVDQSASVASVVAVPVALYSVTVVGPRWAHRTAIGTGLLGVLVASALMADRGLGATAAARQAVVLAVFGGVVLLAVWAFGLVRRSRRETLEALRDRAERLEVERDQQTRLATSAERTRIARELHDIVAHSLSVMIAQADGGRYAAATDPTAPERSLTTIAETGRAALADMRRILGVLRADTDGPPAPGGVVVGGGEAAGGRGAGRAPRPADAPAVPSAPTALAPQPSVEGLEALVEQVRAGGPRVSLVRVGTPRQLPPGAALTIFRVAQEALTNVLKHAGPSPNVTVVLRWDADAVVLDVQDDGRGAAAASDGGGYGLLGMRERAAVFGGPWPPGRARAAATACTSSSRPGCLTAASPSPSPTAAPR
ncbi:two-component sensor histidine kinase [Luteimicrobium album]|uniref:histidine kinase n=1 Tax=Luteimicrobium album TaxID=1054550 RepID=A0ABQ6I4Y7_9MICO|nr:histidine kinase [Luteimicrobium album]GMA25043.1 two-component sensor histidine kinase [Luteimicrobium album]